MKRIFLYLITLLVSIGASFLSFSCDTVQDGNGCRVIYDFEREEDLDGLNWKCRSWYERSRDHATHGKWSLRVEMYPPETYPGLGLADLRGSWKGTRLVRLDMFNPGIQPVNVTFRIDDRKDNPPYEDRINRSVVLNPGMNHITIDFTTARTSGTGRLLKPQDICAFMFFTVSPRAPVTIFVDNIRLCK